MLANIIRNSKKTGIGGGGGGIVIDGGDPYYSAVSLMLSMDGTNGSTTFTDSSLNALTITPTSATISTTQAKYGASGFFNGTSAYLTAASSAITLGTSDFTIEFWIYPLDVRTFSLYDSRTNETNPNGNGFVIGTNASQAWVVYQAANRIVGPTVVANQWTHVAVTRSGSSVKMYINGTQVGSTWTTTGSFSDGATLIGTDYPKNARFVNGYIDDFRISRFARYASNFTPPTAALPTTASSTVADPYYNYTSLLLHMDGTNASTNFVDSGPNALTVTATSATISTTLSKYGGSSAFFNGSTGFLSLTGNSSFQFGTGDFTIEMWVYISANANSQQTFLDTRGAATATPFTFGLYQSKLAFYDGTMRQSSATVTTGQWYHFAACRSGGTLRLFIDGISYYSASNTTNFTTGANSIYIGRGFDAAAYYTNGLIDDFRVTKYARYTSSFTPPAAALPEFATGNDRYFSNVSLLLHMDGANGSTTFTDNSSSPLVVTAAGNAQISTSSPQYGTGSATFDGATNTALSLDGSTGKYAFGTSPFTVEFWMYPTNLTARQGIYSNNLNSSSGLGTGPVFSIRGLGTTGVLGVGNVGASDTVQTGSNAIAANVWQHVALVREGIGANQSKIYVNGLLAATGTISDNFSTSRNAAIGRTIFYSEYFTGKIDDIRITKGIARYVSNFTPPTTAFPDA
jgi:hypothetical protein